MGILGYIKVYLGIFGYIRVYKGLLGIFGYRHYVDVCGPMGEDGSKGQVCSTLSLYVCLTLCIGRFFKSGRILGRIIVEEASNSSRGL